MTEIMAKIKCMTMYNYKKGNYDFVKRNKVIGGTISFLPYMYIFIFVHIPKLLRI